MLLHKLSTILFLFLCAVLVSAQSSDEVLVNPLDIPIRNGNREVIVKKLTELPMLNNTASRIVGMTPHNGFLYVSTSTSGGLIYEVSQSTGEFRVWMDVDAVMRANTGRGVDMTNTIHGGVRSIVFHSTKRKVYVSVMENRNGQPTDDFEYLSKPEKKPTVADSVVLEWAISARTGNPNKRSQREVLRIGMPVFDHPIKQMVFHGKFLYIAHGDGSVQSDTFHGGQLNDGLGKILRINPLKKKTKPYTIPGSNPFYGSTRFHGEIYALGFRNPHNLCFSPRRGDLWVADVGRDNIEEINRVKAGGNYGWPLREGTFVHLRRGGTVTGVEQLPSNDSLHHFIYPSAQYGHVTPRGEKFLGWAVAGSCPIENGSQLNGLLLYANFPTTGELYYSTMNQLRKARVEGDPETLKPATTFRPRIFYIQEDGKRVEVENLREVIRRDNRKRAGRVNLRFGQGSDGRIFWSSKANGGIYEIVNSRPDYPDDIPAAE